MPDKNIQIKDQDGNNLYPKTKTKLVFNDDGDNVETVLSKKVDIQSPDIYSPNLVEAVIRGSLETNEYFYPREIKVGTDYINIQAYGLAEEYGTELRVEGEPVALKSDIPDMSNFYTKSEVDSNFYDKAEVDDKIADVITGGEIDLSGYAKVEQLDLKADKTDIPTNVSQLTNDSKYLSNSCEFEQGVAINSALSSDQSTVIGYNSKGGGRACALGYRAHAVGGNSIAIGTSIIVAEQNSIGIGGHSTAMNAIQMGEGGNETQNTLQIWQHRLLNRDTGFIPDERISSNFAKKSDIPDTSILATKEELNNKQDKGNYLTPQSLISYPTFGDLNNELENYVTSEQAEIALQTKQDKGDYALKSEIPNVSNFITMSDVEAKNYLTSVPSEYVTETELNAKGYLTEHQDISYLATKTELDNKADIESATLYNTSLSNVSLRGEDDNFHYPRKVEVGANYIDIVGYGLTEEYGTELRVEGETVALKSDIPDTSNLATKNELNTKQPVGDYALKSDIPDTSILVTKVELNTKQDTLIAGENITIEGNTISATGGSGGNGFNLFDTKLSDHILEGNEALGWALQGTYVNKTEYPDFYDKVENYYNNATEIKYAYISSNINKVGDLIDRKGVLSGFWNAYPNIYATLPQPFNPETNTWEIQFKFVLDNVAVTNGLFCTSVNYDGMLIRTTTAGKLQVHLSGNGTSYNIANGTTGTYVFEANKPYWLKAKFDGTQYVFSYSTNGIDFIDDITVASAVTLYSTATEYRLGHDHDVNYLRGTIDLNESYIKVGEELWWQGCNYYEYKQAPNGLKFYDITNKSTIDEVFNKTGLAWFYGVDEENERIFLPRNNWFEQAELDVLLTGEMVEAGLPNVLATFGVNTNASETGGNVFNGAVSQQQLGNQGIAGDNGASTEYYFDAGRCNTIYGNSDTVQPNAIKKLLYICVGNTTVESAITNVTEITTTENDTIPLFTGMFFEFKPNNASWLKASAQTNSADVYPTVYDELVNCLNGVNKYNLKVIEENNKTEGIDYGDYWVVSQDNLTFNTPIRTSERILVAKKEPTDDNPNWYNLYSDGWLEQGGLLTYNTGATFTISFLKSYTSTKRMKVTYNMVSSRGATNYGREQCVNSYTTSDFTITTATANGTEAFWEASGYTTIPTLNDYTENVNLYFKVANAVQNLELLNVGEVTESLSNKVDLDLANCTKPYVIEVSDKSLMPSWYRVYSDGWCEQGGEFVDTGNVTFLKEYASADYTININYLESTATGTITVTHLAPRRTATGFTVASSSYKKSWQTSGYIS